jgi:CHASE1-domain containing sensor protein
MDSEARARLSSMRDVCEHERRALENLGDPRLEEVLQTISRLQAEIAAALASFHAPATNDGPGD